MLTGYAYKINWYIFQTERADLNSVIATCFQEDISAWVLKTVLYLPTEVHSGPSQAPNTAQKVKFSIKGFSSKCDQIRRKLRIWSHSLEKSLMENFNFCVVFKLTLLIILTKILKGSWMHLWSALMQAIKYIFPNLWLNKSVLIRCVNIINILKVHWRSRK